MIQQIISNWQPLFKGKPLFQYRLPRSGLSFKTDLEWRIAAKYSKISWLEFCKLDGYEQSEVVAFYRVSTYMEAVAAHDSHKRKGK